MKSLIFGTALLGLIVPANAGTITITVATAVPPCNAGACTKTYTDTDANLAKIVTAYGPPCQAATGSPCSALQTLTFWFDAVIGRTTSNVNDYLTEQAVKALPPITPINPK